MFPSSLVLSRSPILLLNFTFLCSLSFLLSLSCSLPVSLSLSVSLSVCLSLSLSVSRCLCLSCYLAASLAVSLSHSIAVSLSRCLALSLYVFFVFTLRRIYFWDGVPRQNPIFRMVLSLVTVVGKPDACHVPSRKISLMYLWRLTQVVRARQMQDRGGRFKSQCGLS